MLDLDLTSPGHSRLKQMPPNERLYMTSYPSLIRHLICKGFQVTALWNMPDLDLTSPGHSRSKQMSPNERPYMTSYPSVVISNRFGDIGHWKPVWPGLTFQGHSRSKTMALNKISDIFLFFSLYLFWVWVLISDDLPPPPTFTDVQLLLPSDIHLDFSSNEKWWYEMSDL